MARAIMHNKDVAKNLWDKAMTIACHTVKRVYFRLGTKKTPYELWKGKKPNVKYFRIFGSCTVHRPRHRRMLALLDLDTMHGMVVSKEEERWLGERIFGPCLWHDHLREG